MSSETPAFAHDIADGCSLAVKVHPGARSNGVTGLHAGAVKISLTTPPTDGRANEALVALLAELLRLPKTRISILKGTTSRTKLLRIDGKSAAEVQSTLSPTTHC